MPLLETIVATLSNAAISAAAMEAVRPVVVPIASRAMSATRALSDRVAAHQATAMRPTTRLTTGQLSFSALINRAVEETRAREAALASAAPGSALHFFLSLPTSSTNVRRAAIAQEFPDHTVAQVVEIDGRRQASIASAKGGTLGRFIEDLERDVFRPIAKEIRRIPGWVGDHPCEAAKMALYLALPGGGGIAAQDALAPCAPEQVARQQQRAAWIRWAVYGSLAAGALYVALS